MPHAAFSWCLIAVGVLQRPGPSFWCQKSWISTQKLRLEFLCPVKEHPQEDSVLVLGCFYLKNCMCAFVCMYMYMCSHVCMSLYAKILCAYEILNWFLPSTVCGSQGLNSGNQAWQQTSTPIFPTICLYFSILLLSSR